LIAYLEGKLVEKNPTLLILEVNGVGYAVNIPVSTYGSLVETGQTVKILTYQHVREDELKLYGFSTKPEKELFELLIAVNGVGPRMALSILSCISVQEFQRSVLQEDLDVLTAISGVGKVDLGERKDLREEDAALTPAVDEAALALISLGYTKVDARRALDKVTEETKEALPVEELIKRVLKYTK
jgi:Holliday junction DNA helicase RuvA